MLAAYSEATVERVRGGHAPVDRYASALHGEDGPADRPVYDDGRGTR